MTRQKAHAPKIALALAGGGPLGAIYEIGALCALQESLQGIDFNRLQHYVGVSAGSFIAAGLANGVTPRQLFSLFIEDRKHQAEAFDPAWLLRPAFGEFFSRGLLVPGLLLAGTWQGTLGRKSLMRALEYLSPSLPTGVFSNDQIDIELARLFAKPGRSNDFRQLKSRLTLVATHLDSCQTVAFGRPGWDHVPISKAVQASAALPGLFPPVEIDGQHFVDGALIKTMHASIALEEGVDLMLCINPLVPFDASKRQATTEPNTPWAAPEPIPRIADGGLPAVLSQTFRSLIHSRLILGLKSYEQAYPNTDILLIEPDHRDPELYLANTFSYSQRRHLAEHAYQQTRQLLRSNQAGLVTQLGDHGITLNHALLDDTSRHLCRPQREPTRVSHALTKLHTTLNTLNQVVQVAAPKNGQPTW
ncbi:patatin-like phospholipase family protein [Rhodoferax sp.]|uniref:patatin-like phospholipase family protein n=1 Tax=Rhodoferax sp. TaxID=50421 RepID=UPI0027305374|nr:patatin-like phospholipase family protein [Rhodoferax sp.]MDP2440776.1 patatin-like phospholipase family protein [Rhodoferax sp.]MDP3189785.1 patatin-like phospholipase family protein [Rhodoferax sp.]MDZ4209362.1 patatin-like phospholipase family protein [Rhodoferax sp.]